MRPRTLSFRLAIGSAVAVFALSAPSTAPAQNDKKGDEHGSRPAHILIIRHAEKPPDNVRSVDLSPAGVARAKALPQLFTATAKRPDTFPKPDFIFAAQDTKHSHRPVETVTPLGAALGVRVDARYPETEGRALAHELLGKRKYDGKTILIAWHQGTISELAKALGAKDAPNGWKDSVFDHVWVITYGKNGTVSFEDRPQHLMPGDSGS